jgi:hypothetical protein
MGRRPDCRGFGGSLGAACWMFIRLKEMGWMLDGMYYSIVKVCFFSKDFRQPVFSAREVY